MTLSHPEFLVAAPLVMLLLAWALLARMRRLGRLADAYGNAAAGRLLPPDVRGFPAARLACLLIASLAICLAGAGFGVQESRDPKAANALDIVITVDVSVSMGAPDIKPARIQRARDVVMALSKDVPNARLSLVLVGDWPYTLVPPTDDPNIVAYFAQSLTGALLSNLASSIRMAAGDQGTSMRDAIAHARETLDARPTPGAKKILLMISDGAVPDEANVLAQAVRAAAGKDVAVWTAGTGVESVGDALLQAVAKAGGGEYEDVSSDRGLRSLVSKLRGLTGVAGPEDVVPERIFFWLLLLAIAVLLYEGGLDVGRHLLPPRSGQGAR